MTDKYLQREVLTLPSVEVWHRDGQIVITSHLAGTQAVISQEEFAAAIVDGWAVRRLEVAQLKASIERLLDIIGGTA